MKIKYYLLANTVMCCLFAACHTSLTVQPSIKREFLNKTKNLRLESANNGNIGLITIYKEDTLNKQSIIPSSVKIIDIKVAGSDTNLLNKDTVSTQNEQSFIGTLLCSAEFQNDTLILNFDIPFNQTIQYQLIKNKLTGYYIEKYKNDNILKRFISDKPVNQLKMPLKQKIVVVDKNDFKKGDILFGKASYQTSSYYLKNEMFNNGYINKQIGMEFIFRVKIQ